MIKFTIAVPPNLNRNEILVLVLAVVQTRELVSNVEIRNTATEILLGKLHSTRKWRQVIASEQATIKTIII